MSQSSSVCDQGTTNRVAIKALTQKYTNDKASPYNFVLNGAQILTMFDILHLLKNTRNCLLTSKI